MINNKLFSETINKLEKKFSRFEKIQSLTKNETSTFILFNKDPFFEAHVKMHSRSKIFSPNISKESITEIIEQMEKRIKKGNKNKIIIFFNDIKLADLQNQNLSKATLSKLYNIYYNGFKSNIHIIIDRSTQQTVPKAIVKNFQQYQTFRIKK